MADLSPLQIIEQIEHGLRTHDFNRVDQAKHLRCVSLIDLLVDHFGDCDDAAWEVIQLRTYSDSVFTTHRDSIVRTDLAMDRTVALACCKNLKQIVKEQAAHAVA